MVYLTSHCTFLTVKIGTIMFACHTIQPSPCNDGGTLSYPQCAAQTHKGHVAQPTFSGSLASLYPPQLLPSHLESSSLLNYNRWTTNNSLMSHISPISVLYPAHQPPCDRLPSLGRQADSQAFSDLCGSQQGYQTNMSPNMEYLDRWEASITSLSMAVQYTTPPPHHHVSPGAAHKTLGHTSN